ncbi:MULTISPECIES: hypothetical protein [unclassified Oceanispirochaeta]|uniref:hypothetical protein n=1 Tax=unclassified Oceanispirochaeta TaxID=2635722 RepID=UPI000E08CF4D|nr:MULTISPECIES: hypothetical protein [unclassified Oceanispirochaeta]MBF9017769.1 hypothetical protein [Oceanispirochaeta sp. M2]NPD74333.1 hypothetical protein [Oceanispirochaeta sp. M1]RDG29813.1 hypothetical protein DV872_19720 [Oceanispirochaeta sp. M1]
MKIKLIPFLTYAFSLFLVIWYLTALYWVAHPKVSDMYRFYYIEQMMYDWPGEKGLQIPLNQKLYFGTTREKGEQIYHRDKHWSKAKEEFAVSSASRAGIYFKLNEEDVATPFILSFHGASEKNASKMQIYLNGKPQETVHLDTDIATHSIALSNDFYEDPNKTNHLEFQLDEEQMLVMDWLQMDNVRDVE